MAKCAQLTNLPFPCALEGFLVHQQWRVCLARQSLILVRTRRISRSPTPSCSSINSAQSTLLPSSMDESVKRRNQPDAPTPRSARSWRSPSIPLLRPPLTSSAPSSRRAYPPWLPPHRPSAWVAGRRELEGRGILLDSSDARRVSNVAALVTDVAIKKQLVQVQSRD
jgi:hypothetical protein